MLAFGERTIRPFLWPAYIIAETSQIARGFLISLLKTFQDHRQGLPNPLTPQRPCGPRHEVTFRGLLTLLRLVVRLKPGDERRTR